jgi:nucleoside-diphosphate-sugar epimerase
MKVLYVGGNGQVSFDCVHESVRAGHEVWVFNRGRSNAGLPAAPQVRYLTGDFDDHAAYRQIAAQDFDVVCQFRVFDPDKLQRDLELLAGHVGQYVFISTASAYAKPVTAFRITEDVPLRNPYWVYSRRKADCEALLAAQSALPWTIVRPSHTSRDALPTALSEGDLVVARMLRGQPVILPGDGTSLWTVTASKDFAPPFVRLLGHPRALGQAFHLTSERPYSWNMLYAALAAALGVTADVVHVPSDTLVKFNPAWSGGLLGDKMWSMVFDNSKLRSVVGEFQCATPLADFMAERVAAFERRGGARAGLDAGLDALLDRIAAQQRALGG